MISSIEIRLFRGIRECRIKGLETINVFIGKNNHGKSSILEALYLASGAFRFDHPWENVQGKQKISDKIHYLLNRRSQRGLNWHRDRDVLWYNYNREQSIKVDIVRRRKKYRIRLNENHPHPFLRIPINEELREIINSEGYHADSKIGNFCLHEKSLFTSRQSWNYKKNTDKKIEQQMRLSQMKRFMNGMIYIDHELIYNMSTVEKTLWKGLLRKRYDKLVVEVLRKGYEIDIEDLTYIPYGEMFQLAAKLPTTTIRVDDLGDGARFSMIWIMVAALASKTAILIEEPENHQHPSGLAKSLQMLLQIVKKNRTQLFMTTHSLEFVRILEKIAEELGIKVQIFFIEMDGSGRIEPREITPNDSKYLAKMGLDMRFLDIL